MLKGANKTAYRARPGQSGISMVLVVVMLMVFMILGAAVLGASSATTAAASRNGADRQAYYYARSAVDVLDASLHKTDNKSLSALVLGAAAKNGSGKLLFSPAVTFPGNAGLDGLSLSVTFTGDCTVTGGNSVACQLMEMAVKTTYQEQTYVIYVVYRCSGTLEDDGSCPDADWYTLQVK